MRQTTINWADVVWNPVTGCTPISAGCTNCYAARMATRLRGRFGYPADDPFRVTLHRDRLDQPQRWKKPRRVFVCSMGDLWHPDVDPCDRAAVIRATNLAPQHTYLLVTKRPELVDNDFSASPNFWLGVTAENQAAANARIPQLLKIPAAMRFLSIEPMLGPIELDADWLTAIDWVILGGESGPGCRPCNPDWMRAVVDQCLAADVPPWVKQMGGHPDKRERWEDLPEDLGMREVPR